MQRSLSQVLASKRKKERKNIYKKINKRERKEEDVGVGTVEVMSAFKFKCSIDPSLFIFLYYNE
jgi:hypothetical protein